MEMQHARYFVSLANHLNFTKASEHCDVSQPSLTRAIQTLEAELGGPLFRRERANTHLTELGQLIQPYLTAVVENAAAAKVEACAYAQFGKVTLKIGVARSVAPTAMTRFMAKFHTDHPEVKFIIKAFDVDPLLDELKSGSVDLAIIGGPYKKNAKFHTFSLYSEIYSLCVHRQHPLADVDDIGFDSLAKFSFISREHCYFSKLFESDMFPTALQSPSVLRTDRDDWALEAISAGLGYGVMAQSLGRRADLISKPLDATRFASSIDAITVRGRQHSPAFGAFVRDARKFIWS